MITMRTLVTGPAFADPVITITPPLLTVPSQLRVRSTRMSTPALAGVIASDATQPAIIRREPPSLSTQMLLTLAFPHEVALVEAPGAIAVVELGKETLAVMV